MLSVSGKMILSKYIAESIAIDCRTFHLHRPWSTAYKSVFVSS